MDDELRSLTAGMDLGGGTSASQVARIEEELGIRLPSEYVRFMVETNGGEGPVGDEGYAALYPIEELPEVNRPYAGEPFDNFEGLVIFGSDLGGEAFCFDAQGIVVMVGYISSPEDNVVVGPFREFMRRLGAGGSAGLVW